MDLDMDCDLSHGGTGKKALRLSLSTCCLLALPAHDPAFHEAAALSGDVRRFPVSVPCCRGGETGRREVKQTAPAQCLGAASQLRDSCQLAGRGSPCEVRQCRTRPLRKSKWRV
ncbi:uncharacterized protein BDZ99DRAFT_54914 [Mytilinidion resinicola]|uniref:Uncharacterized protein n=1 Tax=Mytilinidion resinicola TaxID=574789 RepID=A0A6A6YIM4_9PEZI|nr:uncharacterized protein BDZ99DRAFT_54914 [Mytilinidion resinicola]KAF2808398.1 hypothetical protein BDZ99DRAFT_54914 [Mytilinidion resinicola]